MSNPLYLKKEVYESKKARDVLDEEFTEFKPIKRTAKEFFNIYNTKFYNILKSVHKFFMEQSLKYIVDYINPKVTQVQELTEENINLKIDIDSVEHHHPIFPNQSVLRYWEYFYFMHSGKRRRIGIDGKDTELLGKIKIMLRKGGIDWNVFINLHSGTEFRKKNKHLDDDVHGYTRDSKKDFDWFINGKPNPSIYYPGLQGVKLNHPNSDKKDNPFNPKVGGSNFDASLITPNYNW